jgi:predicted nucleotidyltransferase
MVNMRQIEAVGRTIAKEFRPWRIVLFGSYARGTPTPDSDVDLLVVMPFRGRSAAKSAEIRLRVRVPFAMDVLVRTPQSVRRRLAMGDQFLRDVLGQGKVLYEAPGR